ncbi:MAG TPA: 16S rRNA (adenine(1518)-N(6)/adenine(1519)-N(6))-dimethyltransferase RsmA [Candidatus Methylomirabilis sp.]|nr:16S rRNA (adenine(1518)-N(6)/adenine(1519)-N(6))-dimethyltransferase RsmA [Candidatus Methylomirabilis sp.]
MNRGSLPSPSLLSQTRALLRSRGLRPKAARSQHFLVDSSVRDAIVEAAGVGPGSLVVEIGPGTGVLTEALLRRGASILALEIDRDLASALSQTLGRDPRFIVHVADALDFDFSRHLGTYRQRGRIRVVANIPYSITSPLIHRLLPCRELFEGLYLTIQREVAERITAPPGTKAYGSLTLHCQYYADTQALLAIPRGAFYPVPEVDSMLVRFDLLDAARVSVSSPSRLFGVIRASFAQRRKTLRNALRQAGWSASMLDQALAACGIAGQRRGETLTLQEFARLSEALPAVDMP